MDILTTSLQTSDIPLKSNMTFCDRRSMGKVRFIHFVYKINGKVWFLFWFGNQSVLLSLGFTFNLFKLATDPDEDHKTIKYNRNKTMKYIKKSQKNKIHLIIKRLK